MIFGRANELAAIDAAYADMLLGRGSVLFLTGEAGLGKTTLVHAWAKERDAHERSQRESIAAESQQYPLGGTASTLFLEAACSIPIGNVDVGRLEALQPWADVVAQLHEELATDSNGSTASSANSGKSDPSNPTGQKSTVTNKLDVRKLMRDAAPAWLWALPFVGEVAHAALVTARLVQDQRAGTPSQIHSPTAPDPSSSPVHHNASTPVIDERQFAAANQEQVFQQYVNLLTKISETTPLVIFLDDLHWADTSSCNLLFYLARQIAGKNILVIATYRQDDAVGAEDGKGHAIITVKNEILRYSTGKEFALSYLNRDAIRSFLANTFAMHSAEDNATPRISELAESSYLADDTFEAWLHKISDGNSLFMTQFVKTLREDGHLDDNGRFVGDYDTVVVPTSALAVVEERTRRLSADTRKLLMYATAEGEEFTTYILERLTKKDPMELFDELHAAAAVGLITQRGTGRLYANATTGIFGFSHALFHKALYNALLDVQKQHLHQQCFLLLKAEWDRLADSKTRSTTLAMKLLVHAGKCEEWATVAEVALAAAREFWKSFNEGEALAMITHVLEASDVTAGLAAEHAEALSLRGSIGSLRGRYDAAKSDFTTAEELFRSVGTSERAVDVVMGIAHALLDTACYDASLKEAARALAEAHAIGYAGGEAKALNCTGRVHRHRGDIDEALPQYQRSLSIYTAIGDRRGEATVLNNIGIAYHDRDDIEATLAYYARSLEIYTDIGDRRGEASVLNNIGNVYSRLRDYDEALAYYARSLAIFATIGNRQFEANSLNGIGSVHRDRGAHDDALSCYARCLAVYTGIGDRQGEAYTLHNIGIVYNNRGDNDEALTYCERCLEICISIGDRSGEADVLNRIGVVHNARGAYEEALLHYGRSIAIYTTINDRRNEGSLLNNIGCALRLSSNIVEARSNLEQGLAIATSIAAHDLVAEATAELGLVAEIESQSLTGSHREKKCADAQRLVEEAIVMFRDLKDEKNLVKWEKELERLKAST